MPIDANITMTLREAIQMQTVELVLEFLLPAITGGKVWTLELQKRLATPAMTGGVWTPELPKFSLGAARAPRWADW